MAALFHQPARAFIAGPTPLHLYTAHSPGTGKGLIARVTTIPALGRPVEVMPPYGRDDELRKQLLSLALSAPAVVLIDNIAGAMDSPMLAAALTATDWSDRVLGRSLIQKAPIRWLWLATANNPVASTELSRRSVVTRLDAEVESPWRRSHAQFRHADLEGWTQEHRGELIWAICTLIRNWIACGRPPGTVTLGTFESWARVMGGILAAADIPGFLENLDEAHESTDSDTDAWTALVDLWWNAHQDRAVGASVLLPLAQQVDGLDLGPEGHGQKVAFGKELQRHHGRIFVGHRIEKAGKRQGAVQWRLKPRARESGESGESLCGVAEAENVDVNQRNRENDLANAAKRLTELTRLTTEAAAVEEFDL